MNADKVLDSGAYTMLKETKEEVNLTIEYDGDLEELRENYIIKKIPVIIKGFEIFDPKLKNIKSTMDYITNIPTTEQERNADGRKRVYQTITYALMIELETPQLKLSKKNLRKIFKAGDDATEIKIYNVSDCIQTLKFTKENVPSFGLNHHYGLFKKMIKYFNNIYFKS